MQEEIRISQEDLNNEMKRREREEYYEDKLLEMKMKTYLDKFRVEHELSKYKNQLEELNKEKETLLNEKNLLMKKLSEIEELNNNNEDTINNLNNQIIEAEKSSKELDSSMMLKNENIQKLQNEDNLVNHIIKTFSDPFKKQIYDICSKKVKEALNNNNTSNTKSELKNQRKNKKDNNFMVVSGEREEFVSKGEQSESNESANNNSNEINNKNNNPMMGGFNPQYIYPFYMMPPPGQGNTNMNMPDIQNMPNNINGSPFYFFPFPMANAPQNNNNKNK